MARVKRTNNMYLFYKTMKNKYKRRKTRKLIKGGNKLIKYIKENKNKTIENKAIEIIKEDKYDILKYDTLNRDALYYAEKYNLTNVIKEIKKAKKEIEDEKYQSKIKTVKSRTIYKTSSPESLLSISSNNTGFYPYLNTYIDVDDWLNQDNDNIIIVYGSKNICLKRSYFIDISIDNLILECLYKNNALLFKKMIKNNEYINLNRYGFDTNLIVNKDLFTKLIYSSSKQIYNIIHTSTKLNGINKSFVLHNPNSYNEYVKNFGISYKYQNSLAFYTSHWDNVINGYLREGDNYFNSSYFIKNIDLFGNNKEDAITNIQNHIKLIDAAFYDAPKTQSNIILYRGTKRKIDDPELETGGIRPGYISTTDDFTIASGFTSYDDNCCIYKLELDIGIPYIFLDYISQTKGENEFLLPRNLILEYKKRYEENGENIVEYFVKLDDKKRYKEKSICKKYEIVEII